MKTEKAAKAREVVHIRVALPDNYKCRMGRAVKAYASTQGIGSQAQAIVKIIHENPDIKKELRRIWVIEGRELNKKRDAAKAEAGLVRADRILLGR